MKKLSNVNDDDGDGGGDGDGGKVKVKAGKGEQAVECPVLSGLGNESHFSLQLHFTALSPIYPGLLGIATSQSLEVFCLANFLG